MLLAALAVLIGAALQTATGWGFALVVAPILLVVFSPAETVTTVIVVSFALALITLLTDRGAREVLVKPTLLIALGAVPGVVAGVLVLRAFSKEALQVTLGAAVLLTALSQVRQARPEPRAPGERAGVAVGALAGVLTTSVTISGPPLVLWLQRAGVPRRQTRDTLIACFLLLNILGSGALLAFGQLEVAGGVADLVLLLGAAALGQLAGRYVFDRLSERRFRDLGLALAVAAGTASLVAGLTGL